jgi:hypothetical protein
MKNNSNCNKSYNKWKHGKHGKYRKHNIPQSKREECRQKRSATSYVIESIEDMLIPVKEACNEFWLKNGPPDGDDTDNDWIASLPRCACGVTVTDKVIVFRASEFCRENFPKFYNHNPICNYCNAWEQHCNCPDTEWY